MAEGVLLLSWNNHKTTFCDRLSKLRKEGCYTDVTLSSEGRFYPLHKLVLSTCSEYFEKLFENTSCKNPVIVFNDIKSRELDALVQYMYAGEVSVPQNNLPLLIKAAEVLQIKGLAVPDTPPLSTKNKADQSSNVDSPQRKRQRAEEVPANTNAQSSGYRPSSAEDRLSASSRWKRDNHVPSQQTVSPTRKPRNEPQEPRAEDISLQNVFGVSEIKVEAADDADDNSSHAGSNQPVDLEPHAMAFKSEASEDSLPLQTPQFDPSQSEKDMNPGPSDVLDWQDGIIDSEGGTIDPSSDIAMLAAHSQSMMPQGMQMMPGMLTNQKTVVFRGRGAYNRWTPEERLMIGKACVEMGPMKAAREMSKTLRRRLSKSTVQNFHKYYLEMLERQAHEQTILGNASQSKHCNTYVNRSYRTSASTTSGADTTAERQT